ncbi:MAG: LLM class flavin-dependent oxidoreductase [Candidatus Limnocylindria bacterium]
MSATGESTAPSAVGGERVRFGALCWNQYTDWRSLGEAGVRADRLGFDSVWTWDHLYPIIGNADGPILEGWLTLAGWAATTERVRLGLMVGANTFRNPALVAKMAATLDHISRGRAVLGIGAAWFETEHTAYGVEFGGSPGERLRWLDEAARIMRGMLDGHRPSGDRYYRAREVRLDPAPVQPRLPLLIGGGGERRTLRTVARYADASNFGGSVENVRRKDEVLRRHCVEVGRDTHAIERTVGTGVMIIREDPAEARRVLERTFEQNGRARLWTDQPVGTVEMVVERLRRYMALGIRHFIVGFPAPYDAETMERVVTEVKPALEAA